MIRCLFRCSTDAGISNCLWSFNPLLLRLLGEISLSLLCSHSSRGSALDLDPPLRVGRLRASVLRSDRTGLKKQLIRGLWLTQAGGGGEGRVRRRGEPAAAEAGVTLRQPEARRAFSRGSCSWITGPWQWRAAQAPGRGGVEWPVLAHRLLGGGSSSLSVSCPSLGSALTAAARACLWSSFSRRSESTLLVHQETKRQEKVSCLFGSSRPFPGLPPS